jgi:hypothetical protein
MSNNSDKLNHKELESRLKGKTLQVYWHLLGQPNRQIGVRELQRNLGFSSPSVAFHHLEKLQDLGLVDKKRTGEYYLVEEVKVGILQLFTRMGGVFVPRYLFYSILFSTMLIAYLMLWLLNMIVPSFYALTFGLIGAIILWIETFRLWKAKTFLL